VGKMADVFNLVASEVDKVMPASHYGVDSLVAVQLRNQLVTAAMNKVTVFEILQTPHPWSLLHVRPRGVNCSEMSPFESASELAWLLDEIEEVVEMMNMSFELSSKNMLIK
jgi:hypothetical protein